MHFMSMVVKADKHEELAIELASQLENDPRMKNAVGLSVIYEKTINNSGVEKTAYEQILVIAYQVDPTKLPDESTEGKPPQPQVRRSMRQRPGAVGVAEPSGECEVEASDKMGTPLGGSAGYERPPLPKVRPLETAPKDGTFVLLFGESGYRGTKYRCEVCKYDAVYRPRQPWITYSGDSFLDSGGPPVGWLPVPE